jgi:hypothetical protein
MMLAKYKPAMMTAASILTTLSTVPMFLFIFECFMIVECKVDVIQFDLLQHLLLMGATR